MKKKIYEGAYSIKIRIKAIEMLSKESLGAVSQKTGICRQTLYNWLNRYDGTKNSLDPMYRAPFHHANEHTKREMEIIKYAVENYSDAGFCELFSILVYKLGYERSPSGFFKQARKQGYLQRIEKRKFKRKNKIYFTPRLMGKKWQLDVKYIPRECSVFHEKFYQYTVIDEATRQRFIFPFKEYNQENTILFIKMAISYFGYKPQEIQTDNGREFTNHLIRNCETASVGVFDVYLDSINVHHKLIRPATPHATTGRSSAATVTMTIEFTKS